MNQIVFIIGLALLAPSLCYAMGKLIGVIIDEFREGHTGTGLTIIALTIAVVLSVLPWWML